MIRFRVLVTVLASLASASPALAQPFILQSVNAGDPKTIYGRLALADVDANGFMDLSIMGNVTRSEREIAQPTAFVLMNGATSAYGTEVPFDVQGLSTGLWHGSLAWSDLDGDGTLDLVAVGASTSGSPLEGGVLEARTAVYSRDATGAWTERVGHGIADLYAGSVAVADVDADGDQDLLVTGLDTDEQPHTMLYLNVGDGHMDGAALDLPGRALGEVRFGDLDGDGFPDLLLSGADAVGGFHTAVYRNDGSGGFEVAQYLEPLAFLSADWGDYDADGDLDLVIAGAQLSYRYQLAGVTRLYRNDGGVLVQRPDAFAGALYGSARWGDYDNDGRLDLLVSGLPRPGGGRVGHVYRNEGGSFRLSAQFLGTFAGNAEWGDLDNDGDLDLALTGSDLRAVPTLGLMRNESRIVNNDPGPPSSLAAYAVPGGVGLSWAPGSDDETPDTGLTYTVHVESTSGTAVLPSLSDGLTGRRLVPRPGNAGSATALALSGLAPGTYRWAVQTVDTSFRGSSFAQGEPFTVVAGSVIGTDTESEVPVRFGVSPAWPNPFSSSVATHLSLPDPGLVRVEIYDPRGARVAVVHDGSLPAGAHRLSWTPGRDLAAGVYRMRIMTPSHVVTLPVVRIR